MSKLVDQLGWGIFGGVLLKGGWSFCQANIRRMINPVWTKMPWICEKLQQSGVFLHFKGRLPSIESQSTICAWPVYTSTSLVTKYTNASGCCGSAQSTSCYCCDFLTGPIFIRIYRASLLKALKQKWLHCMCKWEICWTHLVIIWNSIYAFTWWFVLVPLMGFPEVDEIICVAVDTFFFLMHINLISCLISNFWCWKI